MHTYRHYISTVIAIVTSLAVGVLVTVITLLCCVVWFLKRRQERKDSGVQQQQETTSAEPSEYKEPVFDKEESESHDGFTELTKNNAFEKI